MTKESAAVAGKAGVTARTLQRRKYGAKRLSELDHGKACVANHAWYQKEL